MERLSPVLMTAFVRSWMRSLLESGRHLSEKELLGEVEKLLAQLERMKAAEARLTAAAGE